MGRIRIEPTSRVNAVSYTHLDVYKRQVQPFEVYRGQLVNDDRRLQHPLLVDEFHDAGVVQSECRPVDVLAVGIVAHA